MDRSDAQSQSSLNRTQFYLGGEYKRTSYRSDPLSILTNEELGISLALHDTAYNLNYGATANAIIYSGESLADDAPYISGYSILGEISPEIHIVQWLWFEPTVLSGITFYRMEDCLCIGPYEYKEELRLGGKLSINAELEDGLRVQGAYGFFGTYPFDPELRSVKNFSTISIRFLARLYK